MGRGPLVARKRVRSRYIVDGYNVLLHPAYPRRGTMPLESVRTGFVGLLRTFAARERCTPPLVVVFDVRSGPPPPSENDSPWLRVAHAANADDWIVAFLASESEACVVTSDIELIQRAHRAGATTELPERFITRIRAPRAARRARWDARGGKPAPPRGDALLRALEEQSAPRDDDGSF